MTRLLRKEEEIDSDEEEEDEIIKADTALSAAAKQSFLSGKRKIDQIFLTAGVLLIDLFWANGIYSLVLYLAPSDSQLLAFAYPVIILLVLSLTLWGCVHYLHITEFHYWLTVVNWCLIGLLIIVFVNFMSFISFLLSPLGTLNNALLTLSIAMAFSLGVLIGHIILRHYLHYRVVSIHLQQPKSKSQKRKHIHKLVEQEEEKYYIDSNKITLFGVPWIDRDSIWFTAN